MHSPKLFHSSLVKGSPSPQPSPLGEGAPLAAAKMLRGLDSSRESAKVEGTLAAGVTLTRQYSSKERSNPSPSPGGEGWGEGGKDVGEGELLQTPITISHGSPDITRRKFLASAGVVAAGLTILKPELVRGTSANSKINLGVIGCGGPGSLICRLFAAKGNYQFLRVAGFFQDPG